VKGCQRGFSLLEALIALSILGIALLMGMSLLLQEPRIVRRLDAQREALRTLEATLEAVRAGAVPLVPARIGVPGPGRPGGTMVWLEVEPAEPPGLYAVTARVRYTLQGEVRERSLETLVWSPDVPPID
jgi:prepilin-type N-terminal cleavage/methylation domain-containing protein